MNCDRGCVGISHHILAHPAFIISLIDVLVDEVMARRLRAVHLVPPVADEVALIEEGPHGAEERVRASVVLTHVEDLKCGVVQ